jgi:hypothetical protein
MNQAQDLLAIHLAELGLDFVSEFKFHPQRKWRLDFYLLEGNWGIEIEGGAWIQGRHNRAEGYLADLEKYNECTIAGIKLLRFDTQSVLSGEAKKWLSDHGIGRQEKSPRRASADYVNVRRA